MPYRYPPQRNTRWRVRDRRRLFLTIACSVLILAAGIAGVVLLVKGCGGEPSTPTPTPPPSSSPTPEATPTPTPSPLQGYDFSKPVPERAAVEDSYFADAVFIGDSRTDGFLLYSGLKGTQSLFHTGMNVRNILTDSNVTYQGSKMKVTQALAKMEYNKVYIMLGINELGWPYVSTFINEYGAVIDAIKAVKPTAQIYVQAIIPVTATKSSNSIYTNEKIAEFNRAIQKMCEEKQVYYVDLATGIAPNGVLAEDGAFDGVHLDRKSTCLNSSHRL